MTCNLRQLPAFEPELLVKAFLTIQDIYTSELKNRY
jgi:hypothetical protein